MGIVCHAHQFVYFGCPKTGTNTIVRVLKDKPYRGVSFAAYHSADGPVPDGYLAWATIRNPWTRLLSWWHAWTHSRRVPADPVQGCDFPTFIAFLTDNRTTDLVHQNRFLRAPQHIFIGAQPCRATVRLEHLEEDFAKLRFGGSPKFGRHNTGCWNGSVASFYGDPATKEAIRYGVAEECEALGYPKEIPE